MKLTLVLGDDDGEPDDLARASAGNLEHVQLRRPAPLHRRRAVPASARVGRGTAIWSSTCVRAIATGLLGSWAPNPSVTFALNGD